MSSGLLERLTGAPALDPWGIRVHTDPMTTGGLRADYGGMQDLSQQLLALGEALTSQGPPVQQQSADAVSAAGEVGSELAGGAAVFAASWAAAFSLYGDCARLLGGNVGRSVLVLTALDALLAPPFQAPPSQAAAPR